MKRVTTILISIFICAICIAENPYGLNSLSLKQTKSQTPTVYLPSFRLMYAINNYELAGVSGDLDDLKRYSFFAVTGQAEKTLRWSNEFIYSTSRYEEVMSGITINYKDNFLAWGLGGIIGMGNEGFNLYLRAVAGPAYYWGELTSSDYRVLPPESFGEFALYYNAAVGLDIFIFTVEVGFSKVPMISVGICL